MKARRIRVKMVRCDNAKEQMVSLKKMCWEHGIMVEYTAPYTPQQNGKVERQFPTDLKRANAMLDSVQLCPTIKMTLRKEEIRYAVTKANISIKNNTSPYEKFSGVPPALKPEHYVNFWKNWLCYSWK
jgi:transposase InsO family protein